jgi:DNA helicase-2/ATP-dependent DNA helicase PcrA
MGVNFEGMAPRIATGKARFLDKSGAVYRSELGNCLYGRLLEFK